VGESQAKIVISIFVARDDGRRITGVVIARVDAELF
jgi:hypothetical protein